eukprot:CAMPEP_0173433736 /NCGR_PEP_ID=MMETSP1357-20121228/11066_1 /TAXON_ID=77926 /ORGANISM="Hemiselmis rufescens, Strain PCC563" /LENGTH=74 /DNA_ID=CAMNT_0014398467 /DNA_START=71 /DNA_END=293 /DNA_ORIENTATION=-
MIDTAMQQFVILPIPIPRVDPLLWLLYGVFTPLDVPSSNPPIGAPTLKMGIKTCSSNLLTQATLLVCPSSTSSP